VWGGFVVGPGRVHGSGLLEPTCASPEKRRRDGGKPCSRRSSIDVIHATERGPASDWNLAPKNASTQSEVPQGRE